MSLTQATPEDIKTAFKDWIDGTSVYKLEELWNENFNEPITYLIDQGVFEIPTAEAERNGIVTL